MTSIELYHLLIFADRVGDISSFDLALSLYICRMYNTHDLDPFASVLLYDSLRMTSSIWCTSLGGEEYYYILLVWIDSIAKCDDILFDDIVRFCIYRYDDNMLEIFGSF